MEHSLEGGGILQHVQGHCRCGKIGPGRFKGRLACAWPCCRLCDFGLISSPLWASTVPSLQWGQGEAELWDPQAPSQLCPLSAGLLSLPGRTGVFLAGPFSEPRGGPLLSPDLGWEGCSFWCLKQAGKGLKKQHLSPSRGVTVC